MRLRRQGNENHGAVALTLPEDRGLLPIPVETCKYKSVTVPIAHLISLERDLVYLGCYSSLCCCYKMARFV